MPHFFLIKDNYVFHSFIPLHKFFIFLILTAYARSLVSQGVQFYTHTTLEGGEKTTPTSHRIRLDKSNILLLGPTGCGNYLSLI